MLTDSTADLALALMLGVARRLVEGDEFVRAGEWVTWEPGLLLGHDLHGATVGIIGFGRIGQAVARRLEGFGCEVLHTSRSGGVELGELLERSDFVTLHCPLTPETRGLIGAEALRRMKPSAYLVNTARGPIVDSDALRAALAEGEIAGAALDVTDPEPLPGRPPAARGAQPDRDPAPRLGHPRDPRAHGGHGGRQPAGRAGRRADADCAIRRSTTEATSRVGSSYTPR